MSTGTPNHPNNPAPPMPFEADLSPLTIGAERVPWLAALIETARNDLRPRDFPERHLVDELAINKWRLLRIYTMEKAVYEHQLASFNPQTPLAEDGQALEPYEDFYHLAQAHAPECDAIVLAALARLEARFSPVHLRAEDADHAAPLQPSPALQSNGRRPANPLTKGPTRMLTLDSILGNAVAPAHRERFDNLARQIEAKLAPEGAMELLLTAQIVRANWRLLRCDDAERSGISETAQAACDQSRSRADLSNRRNMAELRRLQTDRRLQAELGLDLPGLVSVKDILKYAKRTQPAPKAPPPAPAVAQIEAKIAAVMHKQQELQSAAVSATVTPIRSTTTGRNAPCPCNSGQKYKRCCGSGPAPEYVHPGLRKAA